MKGVEKMKKKIAVFAVILLLFAFLCSVPASAYVTDWSDEEDYYDQPETFNLKQFDEICVFGNSLWHSLNEVDYIQCDNYSMDTIKIVLQPKLWYDSDYKDYYTVPYATFKTDKKYTLTLEFDFEADYVSNDNVYPYLNGFGYVSGEDFVNGTKLTVDNGHYKLTTNFTTSDFPDGSFENDSLSSGKMSVSYLTFAISGMSNYSYFGVYNIRYSCKVYEESSAITDEDYGYDGNEKESQDFADTVIKFNAQITDLWLETADFKEYLKTEVFDFIEKLEPFKNFVQDIYDFFPDYLEYLMSFVLGFFVVRRFVGR